MDEEAREEIKRLREDVKALKLIVSRLTAWQWSEEELKAWYDRVITNFDKKGDEVEMERVEDAKAAIDRLYSSLSFSAQEVDRLGIRPPRGA